MPISTCTGSSPARWSSSRCRTAYALLSPVGVSAYGFELAIARRYAEAERFGRAALATVERHRFVACRAKVLDIFGAAIVIWTQGLQAGIEALREGIRAARESGDAIFAGLCHVHSTVLLFAKGAPLDEVAREADSAIGFIRSAGYGPAGGHARHLATGRGQSAVARRAKPSPAQSSMLLPRA